MGISTDVPGLDIAYKLCEYSGRGRLKLSADKPILPGAKQVFRIEEQGVAARDVIARAHEQLDGRPLLESMMRAGRRSDAASVALDGARAYAASQIAALPDRLRANEQAYHPYAVEVSAQLAALQREATLRVQAQPEFEPERR
jgi:nicotinate phosphoribosyltransferase